MLIYKQHLPIATVDTRDITLPYKTVAEAKDHILKLDLQYGCPTIWYQADGGSKTDETEYFIAAIGTGHKINSDRINLDSYLGTLQLNDGDLVLHYFLVRPERSNKNVEI